MAKMSVDDKLGVVKFVTDEHESHIEINEDYQDEAEIKRLVMACPAELYKYTDGKLVFNHEGCLEYSYSIHFLFQGRLQSSGKRP